MTVPSFHNKYVYTKNHWVMIIESFWIIGLATVAILDFMSICDRWMDAWKDGAAAHNNNYNNNNNNKRKHFSLRSLLSTWNLLAPIIKSKTPSTTSTCLVEFSTHNKIRIEHLFCFLCIIEAFRRAWLVYQSALEIITLEESDKAITEAPTSDDHKHHAQQSTRPAHFINPVIPILRKNFKIWTSVLVTLLVWYTLLPWSTMIHCGTHSDTTNDTSLATYWITQSTSYLVLTLQYFYKQSTTMFWKIAIPFNLFQPIHLIQRLQLLSRWIRHLRYAGPLLRLILKLQDQFWVFVKTWKQSTTWVNHTENVQRLGVASRQNPLIKQDMKHVEHSSTSPHTTNTLSTTTNLSSFPTNVLEGERLMLHASTTVSPLRKQQDAELLKHRSDIFHGDMHDIANGVPSVSMDPFEATCPSRATTTTTATATSFWNKYLISPQTRFSVGWRLIVTCALLSELARLYISWQLSGTFHLSYHQLILTALGVCEHPTRSFWHFFAKILRYPIHRPLLDSTCQQFTLSSRILLQLATLGEMAIGLVGFLDILVWFYTGELDENAIVVPKPFFTRCILPGTLTQVLDHPTVPDYIPTLITNTWKAAGAVGFSRSIRWGLTIYPAIELLLISPLSHYLFHPMGTDEYLKYTASLAMLHFPAVEQPATTALSDDTSANTLSTESTQTTADATCGSIMDQSGLYY